MARAGTEHVEDGDAARAEGGARREHRTLDSGHELLCPQRAAERLPGRQLVDEPPERLSRLEIRPRRPADRRLVDASCGPEHEVRQPADRVEIGRGAAHELEERKRLAA